jgi:subtilisin family serine protease
MQALAAAQAEGFFVRRRDVLVGFDAEVVVFEAPQGMSIRRALKRLRKLDPDGIYDFNHVYLESGEEDAAGVVLARAKQASDLQPAAEGVSARRIGLIDGGIEASHPALRSATVRSHGCNGVVVPSAHGTEVASRLLEGLDESAGNTVPVELFVADIYCGAPTGGSVDALFGALAWLVHEGVPVINLSVVGPPNLLLQRGVELAAARGHLIVAAVGNDGPAAPPLYPASYPQVIAVTGVDGSDKVLIEAGRRGHVDFAAPGADIMAASLPAGYAQVRGTSYAAPIVAGRLAQRLGRPDRPLAERAVGELAAMATDLGARGFDPVYGNGCVGCDLRDKDSPTVSTP